MYTIYIYYHAISVGYSTHCPSGEQGAQRSDEASFAHVYYPHMVPSTIECDGTIRFHARGLPRRVEINASDTHYMDKKQIQEISIHLQIY
jgi:hypothetical protein